MLAAVAVVGECPPPRASSYGGQARPRSPPVLCRHPSSLQTFEFIPVQRPGSAVSQLKFSQVTLAFLGPHPH